MHTRVRNTMASALVDNTDLAPLVQRVKDFMARTD
jgi:hypothetical protein